MSVALVTGATGFIGSHLVRRLVHDGVRVHALCRQTSDFWRLPDVRADIETHLIDLNDSAGLTALLRSVKPDQIFHLASATVVAGSEAARAELVGTNLLGTINMVEACEEIDYRSLVCTGDSFEYTPNVAPLRESDECRPASLHGISKLSATLYGQARARAKDRPIVTLRLFSTYGPADNPRRLVPRMIAAAQAGEPILLSRPEIARDWIYVDDVVELYLEAGRRGRELSGEVYNVGTGKAGDIAHLANTVLALAKSSAEIRWGAFPAPDHDAYPWIADMRKTFATFHWRPHISLEDGIRRLLDGR